VDAEACWRVIAAERLSLAELLDGLSGAQWETPSLCAGWRVRDVASHLVLGADPPGWPARLGWGLRKAGRFHTLNHDAAVCYAGGPPERLAARLREHASSRQVAVPIVVDRLVILLDVLVHCQDIAIPLGIRREMPPVAAGAAATKAWTMGWPFWARRRLRGVRLRATDIDWTSGDGPLAEGPIAIILLALTGRPAALDSLTGPGADVLRASRNSRSRLHPD
jgi:uncharacterized protein (TIGR03083 family)